MRTGIITQARVNSTRLPNKIFLEAAGKPFLAYHTERLKQTGLPVFVATTDDGSEQPILDFCTAHQLPCFRGSEQDVLERFYSCALQYELDTIIRVTSDCPLIDPEIIASALRVYTTKGPGTYYSNALKRTYPRGMDFEIFSFSLLEEAFRNATEAGDREHVTPYIWKNRSGHVNIIHHLNDKDDSGFRITLDTEEDRQMITTLIELFHADKMNCKAIVELLEQHPELAALNQHIEQKKV